ncbi:ABC transporter permease [Natranaeroarchaeum sulfidigenes]|uniref:ABC-type dipeptide/oligopeptide/nickel transportsystem, permease component n=1 Tax=Natranaeroarchaeum sulfidigenes TaxID=2784880 RepID=A0A897MVK3_9EURY|nr:ABC transporter permease [Natranaeroarchaeum sulfidigenes]QSG03093.1 ABC-type dipeptide/oligopeptide/nickel transportsystem, permease component [Natranaeroarchaeum sulfidigenes]
MSRWEYFLKRLLLTIPVLFLVITFLFIMLRMGPIDPVAARLGPEATGAEANRMRERLGLNDPLWEQYLQFARDLILLEGQSWVVQGDRAVTAVLRDTAPPTLWLGFWAIMLPLFIGLPLGFYAGLHPNSWGDYIASVSGILWQAMPNFWLCVMLLAVLRQTQGGGWFGFDWYAFGPSFYEAGQSITGTPNLNWFADSTSYIDWGALAVDIKLILPPALVLGSASMAAELRIGRTAVLETINSNYIQTARAKGLTSRVIVWKHMFRNALIPLVPVITNEAFLLIGGSVIVEQIFNINGLGRTFFQAVIQGDLPLAGSLLFVFTVIILFLNILQDFLYTIIDPRVGYDK